MNHTTTRMASVFLTLFVLILATLGILRIFDVISMEMLTDNTVKVGATLLILTLATGVISWIQSLHK